MSVRKTSVAIDEDLLKSVQEILQTDTIRDTIEAAFQEVVRAELRRRDVVALTTMDGMDLDDPTVMSGAWRS